MSQPTLSQQIIQLEASLGVALLDRSGRTVRVTDAGSVYLDHARRALRELEAARRAIHDVQDLQRGELRLATTPTFTAYLVGPLLTAFQAQHPGIVIRLKEMALDTIAAAVAADDVDLGIAFKVSRPAEHVDVETLFQERLSVVVARHHRLATCTEAIDPQQLAQERLGVLSPEFATRAHVDAYLRSEGIRPTVALECNTISALVEVVRRSEVVTLLPEAVSEQHPDLCTVPISRPPPARTVALLTRKDAYESAAARAFASTLRTLAARLSPKGPDRTLRNSAWPSRKNRPRTPTRPAREA